MANSRSSGRFYEYATVEAAIDSSEGGFYTNEVNLNTKRRDKMVFSVREKAAAPVSASVVTVKLQFKCPGGEWQDAQTDSTIAIGSRLIIEDVGGGVRWRAGVEWDGYTSGSVVFGFDWR
jgi:hypothetical protein